MADNKRKVGPPDNQLIATKQQYEVRDWAKSLGVTQAEIKKAVAEVGHSANKVRAHLKNK